MPRYYFDVKDDDRAVVDPEGEELFNADEARKEANVVAGDQLRNAMPNGEHKEIAVEVRDENGEVLKTTVSLIVEQQRN